MVNAWSGADPVEVVDAGDYELGTQWRAVADITLTHARIYTGPNEVSIANRRARVWTTAGVQLGIATCDNDLPNGWSNWEYDTPIEIVAGTNFVTSHMTGGNYAITANAFDNNVPSADGNVVGVRFVDGANGNGVFNGTPGSFPMTGSGQHHFYGSAFAYTVGIGGNTPPRITSLDIAQAGATVTIGVNAVDDETLVGAEYRWNWGDGSADTVTNYPVVSAQHTYTASGMYAVLVTVTDAGGLSDSAAAPVEVVVTGGRELTFFNIPKLLATEISEAIATTIGGALSRVCVVPGSIAWDECDCGALYVSVNKWFLSETFPINAQGADPRNTPCELPWLVGEIVIQIMRCAPQPEGRAMAPTCVALENTAKIVAVDAYTTLRTTLSVLCDLKNDDVIIDFSMGEQLASGPEGACVGSELRAFVAIPR